MLFSKKKLSYWLIFSIGLAFLILIQYFGLLHYHYLVPPGDDPANHLGLVQILMDKNQSILELWKSGSYPPGYHFFIAQTSLLLDLDPLKVVLWTYPAILVLSGLAIFFLAYVSFGPAPALATFFLYSFTSGMPIQLLNDGGYPNLIAAHIFLPASIAFFILAVRSKKIKRVVYTILVLLLLMLIFLTHHISTFYLLGLVFLVPPIYLIAKAKELKVKKFCLFLTGYLVILIAMFFIYQKSSLFAPARNLASLMITPISRFPFFQFSQQLGQAAIIRLRDYPERIGELISVFGIFGFFYLPIRFKKLAKNLLLPLIIVFSWALFLFFGSRLTFLSNPERMARDLSVPLAILAGTTIVYLWADLKKYSKWLSAILFIVIMPLLYISSKDRIMNAFQYEPMVRYTEADSEIIDYLEAHPGRTLAYTYNFYFPYLSPGYPIASAYAFSDNLRFDQNFVSQFEYVYVVDQQLGWTPPQVEYGLSEKFLQTEGYELILQKNSPINTVFLFEKTK